MRRIIVCSILTVVGLVMTVDARNSAVNPERIAELAKTAGTWTPMAYEDNPFKDWTDEELAGRQKKPSFGSEVADGVITGLDKAFSRFGFSTRDVGKFMSKFVPDRQPNRALPASFDGRTQWGVSTTSPPGCIHPIKDQGQCGSCWAFAAASMLEDRLCIKSGGKTNVIISTQDQVNCNTENKGCNGGYEVAIINYFMSTGSVTEQCRPYLAKDDKCTFTCADTNVNFKKYKCKADTMKVMTKTDDIKTEISTNGPVLMALNAYDDLFNMGSGVYQVTPGAKNLGGHQVLGVGWETEAGTGKTIWIVKNSWGTGWAAGGYFRAYDGAAGLAAECFSCEAEV